MDPHQSTGCIIQIAPRTGGPAIRRAVGGTGDTDHIPVAIRLIEDVCPILAVEKDVRPFFDGGEDIHDRIFAFQFFSGAGFCR